MEIENVILKSDCILLCKWVKRPEDDKFKIFYKVYNEPNSGDTILLVTDNWFHILDIDDCNYITPKNINSLHDFDEFEILEIIPLDQIEMKAYHVSNERGE